jgi:lysophospholipase L1-like esterase
VLVLGDSFTFGAGVADNEAFPARLQPLLANDCGEARRFEVINAGVSGYNTADEVANLERRWLPELDPDLVLLTFYVNDAYDDHRLAAAMRGGALSGSESAWFWNSRFLGWIVARVTAWRTARETEELYRAQFSDDPELAGHNWQTSRAALARAVEITRFARIPLGIVIFPDLHGLDDEYPFEFVHREVKAAAAASGAPVLDLLEAFRGRTPETLWVHPADHHPNAAAHGVAAAELEPWVCDLVAGEN